MANEALILQRASVTIVTCPASDFITYNTMHHMCAGAAENSTGIVGICTIDVGGPLMGPDGMLIGIPFFHDPRFCGRSPVRFLI
jgi:hypothetical protein